MLILFDKMIVIALLVIVLVIILAIMIMIISREFRVVVFEDVVFDSNSHVTSY